MNILMKTSQYSSKKHKIVVYGAFFVISDFLFKSHNFGQIK